MRLVSTEELEGCFDGGGTFVLAFDAPWSREAILRLERLGAVDYFPEFPRPFFRVRCACGAHIRGVEGDRACRVTLPLTGSHEALEAVRSALNVWE